MEVAIIIPTLNRIDFLIRTLLYYKNVNYRYQIFVGDASDNSHSEIIKNKIVNINYDLHYYHWPKLNDRKTITLLAKKAFNIGCKYIAFHGDDDFFIPKSLLDCACFLEENKEFTTAQGKAALFVLDQNGPYGNIKEVGVYWDKNELLNSSSIDRFQNILQNYWVPQFSVHRTLEFLDVSDLYSQIPDRNWGELYHCLSFAIQGKSKFIDSLYMVRNYHPEINHGSFSEWICSPNWFPSYQMICNDFYKKLGNAHVNRNTIEKFLQIYINNYLTKQANISYVL